MSMRTRMLFRLSVASLLLGAAIGVQAANLRFLRNTPIALMRQRDMDSLEHAVLGALNGKKDGESINWVNEGTRNSVRIDATITVANTTHNGERICRDVGVVLNARGQSMQLQPQFCSGGSGAWQLQIRP
ncbi:hypothetical protein PQR02_06350 [Paraburkholderia sediminicola]|uniref:Uncharacterized protein n=1 Tax=Paraburkholderia rhynchosiae TaxID=487049 RepID=A0ACC7N6M0_9BURK